MMSPDFIGEQKTRAQHIAGAVKTEGLKGGLLEHTGLQKSS